MFDHCRAGASTLAALAVPAERLEQVAARISRYPEVNHNYAREHHYNLWFVLTGPNRRHLEQILDELEKDTGLIPWTCRCSPLTALTWVLPWESIRDRPAEP